MLTKLANGAVPSLRCLSTSSVARSAAADGSSPMKRWKNASLFLAIPAVLLSMANVYFNEEHIPQPPFKPYEHMYIRTTKFPWGDGNHSLFHNPSRNPLPDGYEVVEEHH